MCIYVSRGINWHQSAASERWGPSAGRAAGEEAALAARVLSVRALWAPPAQTRVPPAITPRAPSPPTVSRKMRARRRQPRRLTALAPPPPSYCLDVPAQLFLRDPTCKVSKLAIFYGFACQTSRQTTYWL